ncbi:Pkinase-domain-containing protein [Saccharata proteae CBS 121410]|uniref:non-specific serine/threonine protein kinase n=1 Tax=Saccharata proteae CBS 121410 TaxID=1314787 RepID=A0A9P4I069_9PEZI|nr:Pkinase-domain-containing protein [Saccharata proteae CBS 121410]
MADNYQVLEELGSGSFGVVFKAIERSTGDIVAIKHIDLEGSDDDIREIQQEIALLSTCASQFVTQYKTSFVKGVKLWIVMEYLGGGSCLDLMKPGPFSEAHIAIICRELLLGLDYLHASGKIHRDIKAANVLLSQTGKVKIADFGVAAQLTNIKSQRMTFVGTPYWMAPEVIQEMGYDFKADIWSLGITAMELAKGEPPHADTHPMKILFHIPKAPAPRLEGSYSKDYKDFVASCLIKDPDRRPTAKELLKHRFIQRAGKVEALRELIERKQMFDVNMGRPSHPKYYEETMHDVSPANEDDEWVFDTIKPIQPPKRRKMSRVASGDIPQALLQKLDLNAAPLGPTTLRRDPEASHVSTARRVSRSSVKQRRRSSGATAFHISEDDTQTAFRVNEQGRQPLGLDMSFGNTASTVKQFRRVSAEDHPPSSDNDDRLPSADINASISSAQTLVVSPTTQNDENAHPAPSLPPGATGTVSRLTKESLLGRRAYMKAIDPAFAESIAGTSSQRDRDALHNVAQAWRQLDYTDPQGEFWLLKSIVDRIKLEPKLAASLGIAATNGTPTAMQTPAQSPLKSGAGNPDSAFDSGSPQKSTAAKLVMANNNPHLQSHHRRRQSAVGGFGSDASAVAKKPSGIDEKKLPGYVKPGMEHAGMLADVLYGRWTDGLAARWART